MSILDKNQITDIKICGRILRAALLETADNCKAGISTLKLDEIAENAIIKAGARPSFKKYFVAGVGEFPSALCISINDEIVHGLPDENRILKNGDIVSLDLGAEYHGIYTDSAVTVPVGKVEPELLRLIDTTKASLQLGIKEAKAGNRIGDIGAAVETKAKADGFAVIRDYVGHGIGTKPHMPPQIPNFGDSGVGNEIVEGMALAIEPMVVTGSPETFVDDNGWTVKTADKSMAAHFEHTVVIIDGKPVIVT